MPFEYYAPCLDYRITLRDTYIDQLLSRIYSDLLGLSIRRLTLGRYLLLDRKRK